MPACLALEKPAKHDETLRYLRLFEKVTDPAESAVGFNPATDALQFQLPHVWGDNAVFVTFAKDGSARLEDFN